MIVSYSRSQGVNLCRFFCGLRRVETNFLKSDTFQGVCRKNFPPTPSGHCGHRSSGKVRKLLEWTDFIRELTLADHTCDLNASQR